MEIQGRDYRVAYDPATAVVTFQGVLRLRDAIEYTPISQLLDAVIVAAPPRITLDVQGLQFLNSAGIHTLLRFAINLRDQEHSRLVVRGATQVPWQNRSLRNMQRLMPELQLEFV
jgi:hypothetical protein